MLLLLGARRRVTSVFVALKADRIHREYVFVLLFRTYNTSNQITQGPVSVTTSLLKRGGLTPRRLRLRRRQIRLVRQHQRRVRRLPLRA